MAGTKRGADVSDRESKLVRRIKDEIRAVYLADSVNGYQMQGDGTYLREPRGQTAGGVDSHVRLGPRTAG